MALLHFIRTISLSILLLGAMPAAGQSKTLDSLPQASQEEISRICLPVQFREGAGAYRNCVQAEIDLRSTSSFNKMADLTFDDKYAVQQACARAGGQSSTEYQSCINDQINALNKITAPNFSKVSEDELYAIQQTCFDAQSKLGAASYRQCLNTEVSALSAVQAADTSKLNTLDKNSLQLRCSATASTAAQYRQCIADEFESIAGFQPTLLPATITSKATQANTTAPSTSVSQTALAEPIVATVRPSAALKVPAQTTTPELVSAAAPIVAASDPSTSVMALPRNINPQRADSFNSSTGLSAPLSADLNTISTLREVPDNARLEGSTPALTQARVISRPDLVKTIEIQKQAEAQNIELTPTQISESAAITQTNIAVNTSATANIAQPKPAGLWQKFLDALASLDGIGWLVIAGVLALPALLLGLFSLIGRVKKPVEAPANNISLAESLNPSTPAGPGIHTRMARHEREAAELFGELDDTIIEPNLNNSNHVDQLESESVVHSDIQEVPAPNYEHDAVTRIASKEELQQVKSKFAWQSAFGHWLTSQSDESKLETCIEFLIYWAAYGDDRYDPELKKRLFTSSDLNAQDQIKRWVLKQDVFAFSDVVGWLRSNASQAQLEQCIDLAMALLVTENNITPMQNTLFRFLADAFNIGKEDLEQRFLQAFGHDLPDMPRPDKDAWWDKQDQETTNRWDSRKLAARPELEQMKARLGLTDDLHDVAVIDAFRRAARRCHPDRFADLGERERALAEQQFSKFEEARDKLLGVSV